MSQSPIEQAESLCIGYVDFVSPNEIKVALDVEAPDAVALNAGGPRPFPRVNSYVLIPVDLGYVVGQIEWLTIERSPFPKRRGMQDFGLVDLPYPLRKMSLNPVGTLRKSLASQGADEVFRFSRGTNALPPIGSAVLLPTDQQLRSIIESGDRRRVKIGTSPLGNDAEVSIDPDRLFGRHLAILGNTGSGKSCSVAGLIRWSLVNAKTAREPNARFIILDPNGEYGAAFSDGSYPSKVRKFTAQPNSKLGNSLLQVPLWLWNSEEWASFTQASSKAQRPALIQALRAMRDGRAEVAQSVSDELRRYLQTIMTAARMEARSGAPWSTYPKPKGFYEKLDKWRISLDESLHRVGGAELTALKNLVEALEALCRPRRGSYPVYDFTKQEVDALIEKLAACHSAFGGTVADVVPIDADTPRSFSDDAFLKVVEATIDLMGVAEHAETLLIRIRSLLASAGLKDIVCGVDGVTLESWLTNYIGASEAANGAIAILDLSLLPNEIIHIVTAVVARMIFEALQRYRKLNGTTLPTVLVMEEAHTFVKRYKEDEDIFNSAALCCRVFERIAREGRKFGLGLVLSSQRPSELSQTVLSQCNTFLLHRISNDKDQEMVHRLVPDNLKGLLRELPTLPSQHSILLGWASELPILVKMKDLPLSQQPQSADPAFWDVWTGKDRDGNPCERPIDWKKVADDWQSIAPLAPQTTGRNQSEAETEAP